MIIFRAMAICDDAAREPSPNVGVSQGQFTHSTFSKAWNAGRKDASLVDTDRRSLGVRPAGTWFLNVAILCFVLIFCFLAGGAGLRLFLKNEIVLFPQYHTDAVYGDPHVHPQLED